MKSGVDPPMVWASMSAPFSIARSAFSKSPLIDASKTSLSICLMMIVTRDGTFHPKSKASSKWEQAEFFSHVHTHYRSKLMQKCSNFRRKHTVMMSIRVTKRTKPPEAEAPCITPAVMYPCMLQR